jgi:hypothetical protein
VSVVEKIELPNRIEKYLFVLNELKEHIELIKKITLNKRNLSAEELCYREQAIKERRKRRSLRRRKVKLNKTPIQEEEILKMVKAKKNYNL